jgi:hypothetical protein
VIQKSGSQTRLRIAHPVYFDEDGACFARCHWCKTKISVPVTLEKGIEVRPEKFTISRDP